MAIVVSSLLEKLTAVKPTGRDQWSAHCPAHEDHNPSLSVRLGGKGKILLHCFRGCSVNEIVAVLGLTVSDLFPDESALGTAGKEIAALYDYIDDKGRLLYQVVRFRPKKFAQRRPDGLGGWEWKLRGIKRVLYRLPRSQEAIARGETIYIVEGEEDVHSCEERGLVATTNAGGAGKWQDAYTEALRGARLVILPDNDDPGREHAERVALACRETALSLKVIYLPGLPEQGDISDWFAAGHTLDELTLLVDQAEEWTQSPGGTRLFPLTDLGNAERLFQAQGENLRFLPIRNAWYWWTGRMWAHDILGEVRRRAMETVRAMKTEVMLVSDPKWQAELLKHARRSESAHSIEALLSLACWLEGVPASPSEFDCDPWQINCVNGMLDLKNGHLRQHDRESAHTKLCPVPYDPTAQCPRFEQFLEEIFEGSRGLINYIHRVAGCLLTGITTEQEVYFFVGKGANGKGVLIEMLRKVMGDYAADTPVTTFLERRSDAASNDLAGLLGARLVTASEGSSGQRFDDALLKKLTGGDPVTCRFLHREFFSYQPTYKIVFATNQMPYLEHAQSPAIKRRIRIIPFRRTFYQPWEGKEPIRDQGLISKLMEEMPGILAWLVRGCLKWQAEGMAPPPEVVQETTDLAVRMDPLADFLEERCVLRPGVSVAISRLWEDYRAWCDEVKTRPSCRSASSLSRNLQAREGIAGYRLYQGRYLSGICLSGEENEQQELVSREESDKLAVENEENVPSDGVKAPSEFGLTTWEND